jgi:uncharacterized membrane protein YfhO
VDGRPAPILPANHLFRAVPVDAGTHRVRFVYAPASFRVGVASTLLGLVLLSWLGGRGSPEARNTAARDSPPIDMPG